MLHNILKNKNIILASASPRRVEILKLIGLNFQQIPTNINETVTLLDHKNPQNYVQKTAEKKCQHLANSYNNFLIIAADTTVYLNNKILGKPDNFQQSYEYLRLLSGNTHIVYTGVAIAHNNQMLSSVEKTLVEFKNLSDEEIYNYIDTQEPFDKAGGYGIQGFGSQFIKKINGCYFNVMGLPVNLLYGLVETMFKMYPYL